MKLGAGLLLWMIIAVVFFRWASEEETSNTPRRGLDELDRELTADGLEEMTDTTTDDAASDDVADRGRAVRSTRRPDLAAEQASRPRRPATARRSRPGSSSRCCCRSSR